ncbi:16S rRNA (guanine(527)-N(7))-methyltransferase RsmG [Eoetvoesiella caeni]|uniref:Ribosomal RNA small subunit methyltransferase G n=1 Tax=Eoetvoesiella caeni TaxID=645616 RepID=A0A366HH39_9BURK|nr:16S rRNA (guanine(527)-N(7))-methyltransferase RsmG [Eoetvoesiella caeni]MCI2808053.1 16S rRNA (guanine(527)-N(7))-methyltransferase RsmG [Eoetvoesiella caeni]NYT53944.1 16S rRNA (guanine(527)-N(7))-methyltransferase RsmG [Eoetvoesiella caeni]RBP41973.1 16S rRNA m(7)G-527 methyltransferase [Eoetvoesiella caeni]
MAQNDFAARLSDAALKLGVQATPSQLQAMLAYIEQMQRWNRTYNLTAVRDASQMLVQHIFDSLAIFEPLRRALGNANVSLTPTIVDVGSGGGLPGVVLAAMAPSWQVHCVDAVEKKMAFVCQMSGVLRLPNLHAVHARIESLPAFNADIVVSRAFASLRDFAVLAGPHAAQGGRLLAMKGREPVAEIEALKQETDWRVERIESLAVPELDAQRCLVWMSRQGNP